MIEIGLSKTYVGSDADVAEFLELHPNGCIIHAAKEPYHRLFVGYKGRGCPKDSKEYYYALRGNELALNLIDPDNPDYVAEECFMIAMEYLDKWQAEELPILVHCNQGKSRSPAIIFYHMIMMGMAGDTFEESFDDFVEFCYPEFSPSNGIRGFLRTQYEGVS